MNTFRIGIVSYNNALPYLWALEELQAEGMRLEIEKAPPSFTSRSFHADHSYDLCLLPTGAMDLENTSLYPLPWGIVGEGSVRSVCLFSKESVENISTIFLDKESTTTNWLIKILAPHWIPHPVSFVEQAKTFAELQPNEGLISIGDKALEERDHVDYVYDLSEWWHLFVGLPFVFARWVSKHDASHPNIQRIEKKIEHIVSHLDKQLELRSIALNIQHYLKRYIQYEISLKAQQGLDIFLNIKNRFIAKQNNVYRKTIHHF